jgi:hypothetical protein
VVHPRVGKYFEVKKAALKPHAFVVCHSERSGIVRVCE